MIRADAAFLEIPWELMPHVLTRDFESDLATLDELLRLPESIRDTYVSMLHEIGHDRGLAPEGGRFDEL